MVKIEKNNFLLRLVLVLVILCASIVPISSIDTSRYSPPATIKQILDAHRSEIADGSAVASYPWLPDFLIKRRAEKRIQGYQNVEEILKKYPRMFSKIGLPQKYYDPQRQVVISKKIEGGKLLTAEQIIQLADFIIISSWNDAHDNNFVGSRDGHVYIIDTKAIPALAEVRSECQEVQDRLSGALSRENLFTHGFYLNKDAASRAWWGLKRLIFSAEKYCDQKTLKYLHERLADLEAIENAS